MVLEALFLIVFALCPPFRMRGGEICLCLFPSSFSRGSQPLNSLEQHTIFSLCIEIEPQCLLQICFIDLWVEEGGHQHKGKMQVIKYGLILRRTSVRDTPGNHHLSFCIVASMFFIIKKVSYMSQMTSIPQRTLNMEKENMIYKKTFQYTKLRKRAIPYMQTLRHLYVVLKRWFSIGSNISFTLSFFKKKRILFQC